jgi:hypothetical protein
MPPKSQSENKEECPIFTKGTQKEVLIQTIEAIIVLGNRYDWKTGKEQLYYQNFGRALKGEPSKRWESLNDSVRTKTFDNFKKTVNELIKEIMGEDVYKDQVKYLVDTPQPTNLSTTEWCGRVAVINVGLIWLKKGSKAMPEEDRVKKVITGNLRLELMRDFIMNKGDKATTLKEVKQVLRRIDHANAHMKQATEKFLKSKPKDSKGEKKEKESEKGGANMCQLKNHNHAWSECLNNLILKIFTGKLYTEIPASERYTEDFSKTSDEKETKKKSSKISRDLNMIQSQGKTPMVRIDESQNKSTTQKYHDLEYDSNKRRVHGGGYPMLVLSSFIYLNIALGE